MKNKVRVTMWLRSVDGKEVLTYVVRMEVDGEWKAVKQFTSCKEAGDFAVKLRKEDVS